MLLLVLNITGQVVYFCISSFSFLWFIHLLFYIFFLRHLDQHKILLFKSYISSSSSSMRCFEVILRLFQYYSSSLSPFTVRATPPLLVVSFSPSIHWGSDTNGSLSFLHNSSFVMLHKAVDEGKSQQRRKDMWDHKVVARLRYNEENWI